tara:strand:- start:736 stop:993 length:258 start_codon:yes stop_codon:yes gene_type:complete
LLLLWANGAKTIRIYVPFFLFGAILFYPQYHELWRVLHIGVVAGKNDFGHLLSRGGAGEGRKRLTPFRFIATLREGRGEEKRCTK